MSSFFSSPGGAGWFLLPPKGVCSSWALGAGQAVLRLCSLTRWLACLPVSAAVRRHGTLLEALLVSQESRSSSMGNKREHFLEVSFPQII